MLLQLLSLVLPGQLQCQSLVPAFNIHPIAHSASMSVQIPRAKGLILRCVGFFPLTAKEPEGTQHLIAPGSLSSEMEVLCLSAP